MISIFTFQNKIIYLQAIVTPHPNDLRCCGNNSPVNVKGTGPMPRLYTRPNTK